MKKRTPLFSFIIIFSLIFSIVSPLVVVAGGGGGGGGGGGSSGGGGGGGGSGMGGGGGLSVGGVGHAVGSGLISAGQALGEAAGAGGKFGGAISALSSAMVSVGLALTGEPGNIGSFGNGGGDSPPPNGDIEVEPPCKERTQSCEDNCCEGLECNTDIDRCCDPGFSLEAGQKCYCDQECEFENCLIRPGDTSNGLCATSSNRAEGCCPPDFTTMDCFNRGYPSWRLCREGLTCNTILGKCCDGSLEVGGGGECYCDEECITGICKMTAGEGHCIDYRNRGESCVETWVYCNPAENLWCSGGDVCCDPELELGGGEECFCNEECESGYCSGNAKCGFSFTIPNPLEHATVRQTIEAVIDFVFYAAFVVGPLLIIIAAYIFATSGGNSKKIAQAKKIIFWTAVGSLIAMMLKGIYEIVLYFLLYE